MNLSICIPVYNQDASQLLKSLLLQCGELSINIEILVYDDASKLKPSPEFIELSNSPEVKYQRLEKNVGRSAIRNKMADNANGDFLLFIDGDSMPVSSDFIRNYMAVKDAEVVCGGRIYEDVPYSEVESEGYQLHYRYGKLVESRPAAVRKKNPWGQFHSNNFLINRHLFQKIRFNEDLRQYGHEDTFFGIMLKQSKAKIKHLENPVFHLGLEKSEVFLKKTEMALDNLLFLKQKYPFVEEEVTALKYLKRSKQLGVRKFIAQRFKKKKEAWKDNLLGKDPSMRVFKMYKLGYLTND